MNESFERVSHLLTKKDKELRNLSKALYQHDYLDAVEIDLVIRGLGIPKEKDEKKVREWKDEKHGISMIKMWINKWMELFWLFLNS